MTRFRSPSPDEKKKRFSIGLTVSLHALVTEMSQKNRWSLAAMCEVLIEEAANARMQKEADDLVRKKHLKPFLED